MNQEIKQKRKKKKLSTIVLLTDYDCLTREEILTELNVIRTKLKKIFKNHIGKENFITPYDLFKQVFDTDPHYMDVFKRGYWWNIIKASIRVLRNQGDAFIINNGKQLYVLKTEEELKIYKKRVDNDIKHLKTSKKIATEWVMKKKWRNLG